MSKVIFDYVNEQQEVVMDDPLLMLMKQAVQSVLDNEGLEGSFEVSLSIVDKPAMQALNAAHRGIDRVTDVLSFPLSDSGDYPENRDTGARLLGDIVICAARAMEQAEEYGHSPAREFGFLCAHSTLHLLGYDHEDSAAQAAVMEQKQEQALAAIGLMR